MKKIDIYTQDSLHALARELGSDKLYHGTSRQVAEAVKTMPLVPRAAYGIDIKTKEYKPRTPNYTKSIGFYSPYAIGAAAIYALLHPDNHPNFFPPHKVSAIYNEDRMEYWAPAELIDNMDDSMTGSLLVTTQENVEDANYAVQGFKPSIVSNYSGAVVNSPYEYWSLNEIDPEKDCQIIVHGTLFTEQHSNGQVRTISYTALKNNPSPKPKLDS